MYNNIFYTYLYAWYESNQRALPWRETTNPYYIWISEIILQQTRVAQGMDYYLRFVQRFPTVLSLAEAEEDDVLLLWQGLGYYSRARNLHRAAQLIAHNAIPNIVDGFPADFEAIRMLPGVGDYTAGAIASFAYNLPYPALDGNVYRVLARVHDDETIMDSGLGKRHFYQIAQQMLDSAHPRLFNSAIMEFGALYCTPLHPNCEQCPIAVFCQAYAHGTVHLLPVRKPRPRLKDRYLIYHIYITRTGETLIHRRTDNDVWKHLWEFVLEEVAEAKQMQCPCSHIQVRSYTHVLSHQRLHTQFRIEVVNTLPNIAGTKPVSIHDLEDYAFSRLTLNFLKDFALIK